MTAQTMLLLACLALLPAAVQDPDKAAPAGPMKVGPESLEKLNWIPGTWVLQEGKKATEEHWRPLQGNTILGTSHSYDDKKTGFFEFLRITAMNDTIAYIAMPNGRQATVFLLAKLEDDAVVFENPKHDHPQRIRYEKTAAGVTATISQMDGSKAQSFAFKKK